MGNGLPQDTITALLVDQEHRIWVGTNRGIAKLIMHPTAGGRVVESLFGREDGLGSRTIRSLFQPTDRTVCAGTSAGLSVIQSDGSGQPHPFSSYAAPNGLPRSAVTALAEDTAGNLWIGTDGGGVAKLSSQTLLTYTTDDGLAGSKIEAVLESSDGRLCVVTRNGATDLYVNEFDGRAFHAVRVNLPPKTEFVELGSAKPKCRARSRRELVGSGCGRAVPLCRSRPRGRSGSAYTDPVLGTRGPVRRPRSGRIRRCKAARSGPAPPVRQTGLHDGIERPELFVPIPRAMTRRGWQSVGVAAFAGDGSGNLWTGLFAVRQEPAGGCAASWKAVATHRRRKRIVVRWRPSHAGRRSEPAVGGHQSERCHAIRRPRGRPAALHPLHNGYRSFERSGSGTDRGCSGPDLYRPRKRCGTVWTRPLARSNGIQAPTAWRQEKFMPPIATAKVRCGSAPREDSRGWCRSLATRPLRHRFVLPLCESLASRNPLPNWGRLRSPGCVASRVRMTSR
jgi:hypothetical protein